MPKERAPLLGIRLCGLSFTLNQLQVCFHLVFTDVFVLLAGPGSVLHWFFFCCCCCFYCRNNNWLHQLGKRIRWRPFRYRQHLLMRFHNSYGTENDTNQKSGTVRQHYYCIFEVFVELPHGSSLLSAGEHPVLILLLQILLCWFTVNLTVLYMLLDEYCVCLYLCVLCSFHPWNLFQRPYKACTLQEALCR